MKKILTLVIIVLSTLINTANAQIEAEIKSFVDSTEFFINNGRKLIAKSIENKDYNKVKEVYDYLIAKTQDSKYSAFYVSEDLYINLLLKDWEKVSQTAKDYKDYSGKVYYKDMFNIINLLWQDVRENIDDVRNNLSQTILPPEDKEILEIFTLLLKNEKANLEYSKRLKVYNKIYPKNDYHAFIKEYLPRGYYSGAYAFSLGSGVNFTMGNLSSSFNSNASFNISMDINVNKVYTSLYINGSSLKLQKPFSVSNKERELDFKLNEGFEFIDVGLKGGYFVVKTNRVQVAPYGTLSGCYLRSNQYEYQYDDLEFNVFNTFSYGLGLHNELKIKDFKYKTINNRETKTYVSLKVDAGLNYLSKVNHDNFKGNMAYVTAAIVWGFGEF